MNHLSLHQGMNLSSPLKHMATYLVASSLCLSATVVSASTFAYDSSSDPAYSHGWFNGSTGGTGWGSPWYLSTIGGSGSFQIDGGFALNAGAGVTTFAKRSFNEPLATGDSFSFDYFSNKVAAGANAGFRIENANGERLFEFYQNGGFPFQIWDGGGPGWKSATAASSDFHIEFTLTGAATYTFKINEIGSSSIISRNGTLLAPSSGLQAAQFTLFHSGNGTPSGTTQQVFDNFSVIPEPSAIVLFMTAAGIGLMRYRKR